MTKEVLVSIAGLQFDDGNEEAIEIVSHGEYYFKNNKHFVLYEELYNEESEKVSSVKCTLKISNHQVELIKKGEASVHMVFELNKNHMTYYNTPFGDLLIGITTKSIVITEEEKEIELSMVYGLDINYQYVSDCNLVIRITAKRQGLGIVEE